MNQDEINRSIERQMMRSMLVGKKISFTMQEQGINNEELAKRMNVTTEDVDRYLIGMYKFSDESINDFEKALNTKLS